MAPIIASAPPPGHQAANSARPRGRRTRNDSAIARRASGAKMTPNTETARSNVASANGRASASPTVKVAVTPASAARPRATSISRGATSTPLTTAPPRAASSAALPVPQAMSNSVSFAAGAASPITCSETGISPAAIVSYRPTSQSIGGGAPLTDRRPSRSGVVRRSRTAHPAIVNDSAPATPPPEIPPRMRLRTSRRATGSVVVS